MIIHGFCANTTSIVEIDEKMRVVAGEIEKAAKKRYHKLLAREIEDLCDDLTLNVLTKDEACIYDVALANLAMRMQAAGALGAETDYNFQVFVHILPTKDSTYLKVLPCNPVYLDCFNKCFEDVSLTEEEAKDKNNKKTVQWQTLHDYYKDKEPAIYNLSPNIVPNQEKVKFASPKERAMRIARHKLTSHFLNQASGGREIPPHRLMAYLDEALERLTGREAQGELAKESLKLQAILLDLNTEENRRLIFENIAVNPETEENSPQECPENPPSQAEEEGATE